MKLNTILIDPNGRQATLITQPIPGRAQPLVTLLYPDGRARLVDLTQCRPLLPEQQQTASRSNS